MNKVVAVTSFRDYVLIFMESGKVYRLDHSDAGWSIEFRLVGEVPNHI